MAVEVLIEPRSDARDFPRYGDSPTDTLPLTRRAKMLMLLQATISVVTLTAIAGSAINILAGAR